MKTAPGTQAPNFRRRDWEDQWDLSLIDFNYDRIEPTPLATVLATRFLNAKSLMEGAARPR